MEKAHHRLKRGTRRGSRLVARLYLSIYMFAHHAHHERARGTVYTRTCPRLPRPPSPSPLRRATIAAISAPSTFPTDSTNDPSSSPKRYAFPVHYGFIRIASSTTPRKHEQEQSFLAFFSLLWIRIYYTSSFLDPDETKFHCDFYPRDLEGFPFVE